jgi:glycosyltransferase involved in cell wall biosynthesis
MVPVSIVIITKNEAEVIACCIEKSIQITDDVVIIDSGSTDETLAIANAWGCRTFIKPWDGYGASKNKGIEAAKYNWILSIDADEVPDDELIKSLRRLDFSDPAVVYDIKFSSYFGKKAMRFGSWGRDHHIRLFNRKLVRWSETLVHETLLFGKNIRVEKLKGRLHHYSVKDAEEYERKSSYYAEMCARKYFSAGKKAGVVKLYLSPLFGFIKNYIFNLGFLDGREGWAIAKITLTNTRRKYLYLSMMKKNPPAKPVVEDMPVKDSFVVEY